MAGSCQKIAVLLHGPPATGKTTIGKYMVAQASANGLTATLAILDQGWLPGEFRFEGNGRYSDLETDDDLLVIELGCGEPAGFGFPGATRNPKEWLEVLSRHGRTLHAYRLTLPPDVAAGLLQNRRPGANGQSDLAVHRAYAASQAFVTFPRDSGIQETPVDASTAKAENIAARILREVGIVDSVMR